MLGTVGRQHSTIYLFVLISVVLSIDNIVLILLETWDTKAGISPYSIFVCNGITSGLDMEKESMMARGLWSNVPLQVSSNHNIHVFSFSKWYLAHSTWYVCKHGVITTSNASSLNLRPQNIHLEDCKHKL